MKKLKLIVAGLIFAGFAAAPFALASTAQAINPLDNICANNANSEICQSKDEDSDDLIQTIVDTLLFILGLLSVIMIIVAGILYTTSGGDSGKVSRAKNTLTYSIVGLVVAFLGYAIINFVIRQL